MNIIVETKRSGFVYLFLTFCLFNIFFHVDLFSKEHHLNNIKEINALEGTENHKGVLYDKEKHMEYLQKNRMHSRNSSALSNIRAKDPKSGKRVFNEGYYDSFLRYYDFVFTSDRKDILTLILFLFIVSLIVLYKYNRSYTVFIYKSSLLLIFNIVLYFSFVSVQFLYKMSNYIGYQPEQEINFSHKIHAGKLGISCVYCHSGTETGKHALIPPLELCFGCHNYVLHRKGASNSLLVTYKGKQMSPEIRKMYIKIEKNEPIRWNKVHNLPDFVYFNHQQHVVVGGSSIIGKKIESDKDIQSTCEHCHGDIKNMDIVKQVRPMTMNYCLTCHKKTQSPSNINKNVWSQGGSSCVACHT